MSQPATGKTRTHKKDEPPADIQSQIQALAYQLWLERGAPIGSPDQDWLEAESRLTRAGESDQ